MVAGLVLVGLLSGCKSSKSGAEAVARSGLPRNVYRDAAFLPGSFKRVAVLPIAIAGNDAILQSGAAALEPLYQSELIRSARFEVIAVNPEQCRQWTGRATWVPSDTLPREFFDVLSKATGCDAVMFCQLTRYRPYPPVAVGWRVQLVAGGPVRVMWAVDEVFDGGDPAVAGPARDYYRVHFATPTGADPDSILDSPRRFGQFTLTAVVESLPKR
jgi:hypothetical protein